MIIIIITIITIIIIIMVNIMMISTMVIIRNETGAWLLHTAGREINDLGR